MNEKLRNNGIAYGRKGEKSESIDNLYYNTINNDFNK
jgi:hypothetical protein